MDLKTGEQIFEAKVFGKEIQVSNGDLKRQPVGTPAQDSVLFFPL